MYLQNLFLRIVFLYLFRSTSIKAEGIFRLAGTRTTAEEIRDILEEVGREGNEEYITNETKTNPKPTKLKKSK